ncbi:hypothetical protein GC101_06225 [Paenibacillus sp. LMG 31459]|uniref:Uncharacterized protein n=1 Tax=Paenibacillus phytohabitans TaxID=2654978 RepID=A0ABX1YBZ0_9BACL|nr:hypothetical protein [Paenibacillus phytohabitans]NOU78475.1 hypothetical protein [Paenibacillus phytohabitans]
MHKKMILTIKGVMQVLVVIVIHLGMIYFLEMKTEEWEGVGKQEIFITYCCPLILLSVTCAMALKTKKIMCNLIWLAVSLIPSIALLLKLKEEAVAAEQTEPVFIEIHFSQGYVELMMLFPFLYSVIQILFLMAMLIMIVSVSKENTGDAEDT